MRLIRTLRETSFYNFQKFRLDILIHTLLEISTVIYETRYWSFIQLQFCKIKIEFQKFHLFFSKFEKQFRNFELILKTSDKTKDV